MRETNNYVEMKIPAKPEFVGVVRLTVSGIANRLGFHFEEIEDLKIAISEAITNTVQHAYRQEEEVGEVTIAFGIFEDRLEAMVTDHGDSFNLKEKLGVIGPRKQDEPVESLREGGFGLFLIEALMDKVEIINEHGVMVFMTKYLHKDEVGRNDDQISTSP